MPHRTCAGLASLALAICFTATPALADWYIGPGENGFSAEEVRNRAPMPHELLRQAAILALLDAGGAPVLDASFEEARTDSASVPFTIFSDHHETNDVRYFVGRIHAGESTNGPPLLELRHEYEYWKDGFPIEALVGQAAAWQREALRPHLPPGERTPPADAASADAPPAVTELELLNLDPGRCMGVVRRLHAELARNPEDAAVNARLARAYANLGFSCFGLWSHLGEAAGARALILAENLVHAHPESAEALRARAWAYTLAGYPKIGARDLKDAAKLDGDASTATRLLEAFTQHDLPTMESLAETHVALRPMAYGFCAASTWCSDYPHWDDLMSKGLEADPGMTWLAYMGSREGGSLTTSKIAAYTLLYRMAEWHGSTLAGNGLSSFTAPSSPGPDATPPYPDLYSRLRGHPPDTFPSPSAVAGLMERVLTLSLVTDIYCYRNWLGADTTGRYTAWTNQLAGNPHTEFILAADESNDPVEILSGTTIGEVYATQYAYLERFPGQRHVAFSDVPHSHRLRTLAWNAFDSNLYDRRLRQGRLGADAAKGEAWKTLKISPGDPQCASIIIEASTKVTPFVMSQFEKTMDWYPTLYTTLSGNLLEAGDMAGAMEYAKRAVRQEPNFYAYRGLGDVYLACGAFERYKEAIDKASEYDARGLSGYSALSQLAEALLERGRVEEALPYSERAAQSYSAWGLAIYGYALLLNGRTDEGIEMGHRIHERYRTPSAAIIPYAMAGRPLPRELVDLLHKETSNDELNFLTRGYGLFYLGEEGQAAQHVEASMWVHDFGLSGLIAAALAEEAGHTEQRDAILARMEKEKKKLTQGKYGEPFGKAVFEMLAIYRKLNGQESVRPEDLAPLWAYETEFDGSKREEESRTGFFTFMGTLQAAKGMDPALVRETCERALSEGPVDRQSNALILVCARLHRAGVSPVEVIPERRARDNAFERRDRELQAQYAELLKQEEIADAAAAPDS